MGRVDPRRADIPLITPVILMTTDSDTDSEFSESSDSSSVSEESSSEAWLLRFHQAPDDPILESVPL